MHLPDPATLVETGNIKPRDDIEKQMQSIWEEALDLKLDNISIDTDFFYWEETP